MNILVTIFRVENLIFKNEYNFDKKPSAIEQNKQINPETTPLENFVKILVKLNKPLLASNSSEILTSDLVPVTADTVNFEADFAFEVVSNQDSANNVHNKKDSEKLLKFLKSNRTSLKIELFYIDSNGFDQLLGQTVLDLRNFQKLSPSNEIYNEIVLSTLNSKILSFDSKPTLVLSYGIEYESDIQAVQQTTIDQSLKTSQQPSDVNKLKAFDKKEVDETIIIEKSKEKVYHLIDKASDAIKIKNEKMLDQMKQLVDKIVQKAIQKSHDNLAVQNEIEKEFGLIEDKVMDIENNYDDAVEKYEAIDQTKSELSQVQQSQSEVNNEVNLDNNIIRSNPEYKIAKDVETWKKAKLASFDQNFQIEKDQLLQKYKRMAINHENAFKSQLNQKVQTIEKLESKIKSLLTIIKKKESNIYQLVPNAKKLKQNIELDLSQKINSHQDEARRQEELFLAQCDKKDQQLIELMKQYDKVDDKHQQLSSQVNHLENLIDQMKDKLRQQNPKDEEVKLGLRIESNNIRKEKCLSEINSIKEEIQNLKLIKKQNEYLITDLNENQKIHENRQVLGDISHKSNSNHAEDPEVRRLLTNKKEILKSGLYSKNDKVIVLIDDKINHLKSVQYI